MPHSVGVDEIHPNKIGINFYDVTLITDDGIKLSCWFMYNNKNNMYEKLSNSSIRARRRILKECNMNGSITDSEDVSSYKVYVNTDLKRRVPFYLSNCFPNSNNENIGGRIKHFWELYNLMGVNILVFYRGYDNSSGVPSEDGFYLDAKATYEYLMSRTDIVDKDKLFVSGLILENTFKDLKTVWSKFYPIFAKIPFFLDIFQGFFRFIYDTNNMNGVDCSYIHNFNQDQGPGMFDVKHEHKTESVNMEKSQNELSVGVEKSSLSYKNKKKAPDRVVTRKTCSNDFANIFFLILNR
ncbi:hypothetical protein RS030_2376 [Cryptosporidium xiaoi]|uniref:Uncharacterized protein n=1 Tax=Cryptosporidium xiaoi TaxID=659607 RepID=A0AAV9XZ53_9CRYT